MHYPSTPLHPQPWCFIWNIRISISGLSPPLIHSSQSLEKEELFNLITEKEELGIWSTVLLFAFSRAHVLCLQCQPARGLCTCQRDGEGGRSREEVADSGPALQHGKKCLIPRFSFREYTAYIYKPHSPWSISNEWHLPCSLALDGLDLRMERETFLCIIGSPQTPEQNSKFRWAATNWSVFTMKCLQSLV